MPLVSMSEMLREATAGGYAVGYFEAWDLYSLEAALEAAESLQAPVILGFGGAMVDQRWLDDRAIERLAGLGRATALQSKVPVSLLLNEVEEFQQAVRGIVHGFNAVMMHTSQLLFEENLAITRKLVEVAHACGVSVEAELGDLPEGIAGFRGKAPSLTDPEQAATFVRETGVDALAVSIGNVHILTRGQITVDFDRLAALHRRVEAPLVIHGASGFPDGAVTRAISLGVAKFNIGTAVKRAFWQGVKEAMAKAPADANVHEVLGSRRGADILAQGRARMREEVARLIRLYRGTV